VNAPWPNEPAPDDDGLFDPDDVALLLGLPDPDEQPRRPVTDLPDISTWSDR
jgi:hypothetical protein